MPGVWRFRVWSKPGVCHVATVARRSIVEREARGYGSRITRAGSPSPRAVATCRRSARGALERFGGRLVGLVGGELERLAAEIPPHASPARVRELLGEPLLVSELADGGETWLYVPADPKRGRWDSLSVAFAAEGGFKRLECKPAD